MNKHNSRRGASKPRAAVAAELDVGVDWVGLKKALLGWAIGLLLLLLIFLASKAGAFRSDAAGTTGQKEAWQTAPSSAHGWLPVEGRPLQNQ
jgi:hypothetical protein